MGIYKRAFINSGISGLIAVFFIFTAGCGDSELDRVEVTPAEKELTVGESASFKARGFSKNGKEVPDLISLPKVILLDKKAFEKRKKGPVTLNHEKHSKDYMISCDQCHHIYQNRENIWTEKDPVQSCESCHDPEKKQGEVVKLLDAFHQNCKICHREMVNQGKSESAPFKKCSGCHE